MPKLHEVLAAEGTRTAAEKTCTENTRSKFKDHTRFFGGTGRKLEMLVSTDANQVVEAEATQTTFPTSNVVDTLAYFLSIWAEAENVRASKNISNTLATADIILNGAVMAEKVPVDELMGLEARIKELSNLLKDCPTLAPQIAWTVAEGGKHYQSPPKVSSKTAAVDQVQILAPATDKFQAQVKVTAITMPVGKFTDVSYSGLWRTEQKAAALSYLDELAVAVRQARNRANDREAVLTNIGSTIAAQLVAVIGPVA